jgi:hypothetical protein
LPPGQRAGFVAGAACSAATRSELRSLLAHHLQAALATNPARWPGGKSRAWSNSALSCAQSGGVVGMSGGGGAGVRLRLPAFAGGRWR